MSFLSAIRQALGALLVNKSRSALTSLGIVIGISAVIALVSAGSGARLKLDQRLANSGKNLIIIKPGSKAGMGMGSDVVALTTSDADAIRKGAESSLVGAAPLQVAPRLVTAGHNRWGTVLTGSSPDFRAVCSWHVLHGRIFTDAEMRKSANVCVIGQTVRQHLFGDNANPVGAKVVADQVQLVVIGVLDHKGKTALGVDQDDQIFVPLTTIQRKFVGGRENIAMILTAARSDEVVEKAKADVERIMRQQHHLKATAFDDFDVSSVRELAQVAVIVTGSMQLLVAAIASISLLVGGIGIMNVMLVSVTERTREIGIRMSIGATPFDVLVQFLLEAMALALVGGLIGVTLGLAGAVGLAQVADWPVVVSPGVVLLAFAITAGVGIFFGYYPAWKASRMDPIVALRYE
jgi:putative ABC transport system permease protein